MLKLDLDGEPVHREEMCTEHWNKTKTKTNWGWMSGKIAVAYMRVSFYWTWCDRCFLNRVKLKIFNFNLIGHLIFNHKKNCLIFISKIDFKRF